MAKKKATKKEVLDRIRKAQTHIKTLGIKGHSFTLGHSIGRIEELYDIKRLLRDVSKDRNLMKELVEHIQKHEISGSEKAFLAIDYNVVDGSARGYEAIFRLVLLLSETLVDIRKFEKEHGANKEFFDHARKEINTLLHRLLSTCNGVYATAQGRQDVALIKKDLFTSDNYITLYMRMKKEIKGSFKGEKKAEAALEGRKSSADFGEYVKKLLEVEITNIKRSLDDIELQLDHLSSFLVQTEKIVNKAALEHELPAADKMTEAKIKHLVLALLHHQAESVHTFINQLFKGAR